MCQTCIHVRVQCTYVHSNGCSSCAGHMSQQSMFPPMGNVNSLNYICCTVYVTVYPSVPTYDVKLRGSIKVARTAMGCSLDGIHMFLNFRLFF